MLSHSIGNWRAQLRRMNLSVIKSNESKTKKRHMKTVSEHEWWVFWGIIFAACPAGKGGQHLFRRSKIRRIIKGVNFGTGGEHKMAWTRFKDIKAQIPYSFYDLTCPDDPYHPVKDLIDGFNDNRKRNIASGIVICLDESMSPYQPRTTKSGFWPNISFIFRKPKPLGAEKKVR